MPALDDAGRPIRVRAKAKPKVKAKSSAPPRQADQGSSEGRAPVQEDGGKVRMYAHPERAEPKKVLSQQRRLAEAHQEREAFDQRHRDRVRKVVQRIKVTPVASPDSQDSNRSPAQRAHDADIVARNVRESREKVLREQGRGSGARAVAKIASGAMAVQSSGATSSVKSPKPRAAGGVTGYAVVDAQRGTKRLPATAFGYGSNAAADTAELLVTTPSSVAKLASTAVTHPKKVPGMLIEPYKQLVKHPGREISERPVSTALMVQPFIRMPGRVAGKVARVTGKQTLERPAATLPGTSLKNARTGSRDAAVRVVQSRRDKGKPAPVMTVKDVQRRVDEHFDAGKHHARRIEAAAVHDARKATKGQPKTVREAAVTAAREHAHEVADRVTQERFAREFGANVRLSAGTAQREALHTVRRGAVSRLDAARTAEKAASAAHGAASQAFRTARARVRSSGKLAALEFARRDAQKDLVSAQKAHATARAGLGLAKGRAQVLADKVTNPTTAAAAHGAAGTAAKRRGALDDAAQAVRDSRDRVRQLDSDIAAEQQRLRKVVPLPQHQALTAAIQTKGQARAALATARADAQAAAQEHINAKQAMTNSTLVSPAGEGRLFAHKADAATVVKRLNDSAITVERGAGTTVGRALPGAAEHQPLTFVVRQVGEDRWAAVPKEASTRLSQHHAVGSSPAVMAKVMKRSRGAFTQAVLPLSLKWLAGQGVEAGIRAAVAGAGPFDVLRLNHVVKRLNKERPGAGDELMDRVTGGQFDLSGVARDFAQGKSLAEEFEGTGLARPAAAVTRAANTAPMRAVRAGWRTYTNAVLGTVNGAIENTARKAMAGQAIKNSPLMENHIIGLSDAALEDAANGLRGTHNQVALGRAVDRMYGAYSKFGPEKRSLLLHWTPFLPWYLNTATFLFKVLPMDHPVTTSLLASTSEATEQWRKDHGLSLRQGGHVPDFLLGSYPAGDDKFRRIGHYTPWGVGADPTGAVGSLGLPQFTGPFLNAAGVDWKGQRLTHGGKHGKEFNTGEKAVRSLVTGLESQIPGMSQAGRISGLTPRYVDKDNPEAIKSAGDVLKGMLPTSTTANTSTSNNGSSGGSSGRVKIPGVGSGRIKVPGVSGRIKLP